MFTNKCSDSNTIIKIYQLFSRHDRTLKNTLMMNLTHFHKITLNRNQIFFQNSNTVQEIQYEKECDAEKEFCNIHNSLDGFYKNKL